VAGHLIDIAVAARPHPSETVNGDASAVQWSGGICRIAVIDGLGHGPEAAYASARAVDALNAHPDLVPADAIRQCHTALQGTRGAAMAVARLDPVRQELLYAGVGNIEAHLWYPDRRERPISYRGIVGAVLPTIRSFMLHLDTDWTFILHSDGVSARIVADALVIRPPWEPQSLADAILARYARASDDAMVVVATPMGEGRSVSGAGEHGVHPFPP
jgi:serine phosphatase RsbU (regulator of sigma subunit)